MPKVRIFNKDGTVWKETEFVEAQPHCGDFRLILLKRDEDPMRKMIGTQKDEYLITNLSFVVEGVDCKGWRQPEERDAKSCVMLLGDNGSELSRWEGAKCVGFQSDMVFFNVDGIWYSATGNVVIEPEEQ
jgi:hypothetical protein